MNYRELRCGNVVWNPILKENRTVDYFDIRDFAEGHLDYPFEPIPLTSDLLERMGFERHPKDQDKWYAGYNGHHVSYNEESEDWNYHISASYPELVVGYARHLHQLQNLYFALTGQELTLKPETI